MSSGSAYSNEFSAIYRFAKGTRLDVELEEEDLSGKSLLPGYLGEARIEGLGRVERGMRIMV